MVKRYGNLYPQVVAFENLYRAYCKAAKGKRGQANVADFEFDLEHNLLTLQAELTDRTYRPGAYHSFTIHDPKERLISAAPFRDRVVHHALVNVIEPLFERTFIGDSYANRKGKGTHAALDRAQAFARRYRYAVFTFLMLPAPVSGAVNARIGCQSYGFQTAAFSGAHLQQVPGLCVNRGGTLRGVGSRGCCRVRRPRDGGSEHRGEGDWVHTTDEAQCMERSRFPLPANPDPHGGGTAQKTSVIRSRSRPPRVSGRPNRAGRRTAAHPPRPVRMPARRGGDSFVLRRCG
jgi:hypothetical protein